MNLCEFDEDSSDEFYDSPEYTPGEKSESEEEKENYEHFDCDNDKSIDRNSSHSGAEVEDQKNYSSGDHFQFSRATKNLKHKLVKDKRVFCLYCEELVTNFPRHLERKHPLEDDVRKIIIMPKSLMNATTT